MSKHFSFQFPVFVLMIVLASVGCSQNDRLPVTGQITVDGQPLADGYIEFRPLPDTNSPTGGSTIVDGSYEIAGAKGLMPGKFRIEIRAMRASSNKIIDPVTGETSQDSEQFLPAHYNSDSTLVAELDGANSQFNFDLTSDSNPLD